MELINKFIDLVKVNFPVSEISKNPLFLVDIFIVLFIFYWIYKLLKNTKAVRILYGLLLLGIMMYISFLFHLTLLSWLLGAFLTVILVAIPVVFQPELRNALERIGRAGLKAGVFKGQSTSKFLDPILETVKILSVNKIGGIIAIQRKTGLSDYLKTGVSMNSDISKDLLLACFVHDSPLHDGAVIISHGKILGASCIFPLSENDSTATLGTRHKAAVGLSEQTDAVVIVVSERNGEISLAKDGVLSKNISLSDLGKILRALFKDSGLKSQIYNSFKH